MRLDHSLQVWWKGDEDIEYFTLKCRTEEQLKQWESTINKLITQKDSPKRQRPPTSTTPSSYSTTRGRYPSVGNHPPQSFGNHPPGSSYGGEFPVTPATPAGMYPPGMVGLGIRERVDSRATDTTATDEENWTGEGGYDSPYGSSSIPSGRATPSGARRPHASMPVQQRPPGQGANSLPMPPTNTRHTLQRAGSDMSFAAGAPASVKPPTIRSQFSSTRLRSAYEEQNGGRQPQMPAMTSQQARMRSASSPTAYNANGGSPMDSNPAHPPPLPAINTWTTAHPPAVPNSTPVDEKRGSGSSQSTDVSSGFSESQAASPVTPYGSNDSNLPSLRPRQGEDSMAFNPPVKVKVHFREDLFVIVVQRSIEYQELMEKVGRKIRLCGARHDGGQFRVRYQDEDGDMISLASNDDLQIALDSSSVVLYVM